MIQYVLGLLLLLAIFYFIGFLRIRSGFKNLHYTKNDDLPVLSIIVSLHNEAHNIGSLLKHLSDQDYPKKNLEILLVDDRSNDKTAEMLKQYAKNKSYIKLLSIQKTEEGFAPKKYAIDQAIKSATGELILFTDADGRPDPGWARSMAGYFDKDTGMVLGYAPYDLSDRNETFLNRLLALEYFSHAAVAAASTGLNYAATCVGTNLAYRKSVYTELDGFGIFKHIHTGDDDLFLQRVREETDWEIRYATDKISHVKNAPPDSWSKFYNQRLRYASKGFHYPFKLQVWLIIFYLFYLLLFFGSLLIYSNKLWISIYITGLGLKLLTDYLFLYKAGKTLHDTRYLKLLIPALLLHIPYVIYFGIVSQFKNFEWAGRKG